MFKYIICFLITISWIEACTKPVTTASGPGALQFHCAGDLIFEDNFDNFRTNIWQHEKSLYGGGNHEFDWYVDDRKNTFTSNGHLHIKPTLTSDFLGGENKLYSATINVNPGCTNGDNWGCKRTGTPEYVLNPIRTGKVHTNNTFVFKYGKVEIRAKMPAGDWLWPGLWFMPQKSVYGKWPKSGEIDLAECRGNRNYISGGGRNIGIDLVGSTLHWGPDRARDKYKKTHYELYKPGKGLNTDFHNYQVIWTPDHINFTMDGELIGTANPGTSFWDFGQFEKDGVKEDELHWKGHGKMAPFNQNFYIIFNLAIGGTSGFFPDTAKNYPKPKPWKNDATHAMTDFWKARNDWLPTWKLGENNGDSASLIIDYVKVWAI